MKATTSAAGLMPSPRTREVLVLALSGHSVNQIARDLGITSATVRTHLIVLRDAGYLSRGMPLT
jgi:DNA-binding NarL/FixJ family response regulator